LLKEAIETAETGLPLWNDRAFTKHELFTVTGPVYFGDFVVGVFPSKV
jgi:hypothetical protein